jgi:esterase/lipase superfamily enzyme
MEQTLYFATNRRHRGRDQWHPTSYGPELSEAGSQNLRFGKVALTLDDGTVQRHLSRESGWGPGDGAALAKYVATQKRKARIEAFEEVLDRAAPESKQPDAVYGSRRTYEELRRAMRRGCNVLVFIHGFNVSWWEAVAAAAALQLMLNRNRAPDQAEVCVFLFTWPSDGIAAPWFSYYSDRDDAELSGAAIGRGFLRLRDYLLEAWREDRKADRDPCLRSFHLLCHSMGNFVLQKALERTREFSRGGKPPRVFDQIFLCAPDVDDDVFEPGQGLRRLPEMGERVTVYFNSGDVAMHVSDYTKGNRDRLGWRGANRPAELDGRVHQVDCSDIVTGAVEHGYHDSGVVNDDIRASIDGIAPDDPARNREAVQHGWPNVWRLRR